VADLRVLTQDLREAVAPQRLQLTVVAPFAGLGLVLAAVGIASATRPSATGAARS
jgi:hypothetical protein